MKIIEEQNMTDEPNPDITGNMDVPADVPSAKKVYSKPELVVLQYSTTSGKNPFAAESGPSGDTFTLGLS